MLKKWIFFFSAVIFSLPVLSYFIFRENIPIETVDYFDSNHVLYSIMGSGNDQMINSHEAVFILNGVPASSLPSFVNICVVWYSLFPPFYAYIINSLVIQIIAFVGMYAFLKRNFSDSNFYLILFVSLTFSLLPFFPFGGITVAGIPLLLFSLLNFNKKRQLWYDWLVIIVYPIYSNLVWIGIFIVPMVWLYIGYKTIKERKINLFFILATTLFSFLFVFSEYKVLNDTFINHSYVSQRVEFSYHLLTGSVTLPWALITGFYHYLYSQAHTYTYQFPIVVGITSISFWWYFRDKSPYRKSFFITFVINVFIALFVGIAIWNPIIVQIEKHAIFKLLDITRLYFFQPFIWYFLFFLSLSKMISTNKKMRIAAFFIICMQLGFILYQNKGIRALVSSSNENTITYKNFYSETLFAEIKNYIKSPLQNYRVGSIGIFPGITQYNGFYTIDGYLSNYPLEYKHKFRKIIEKELAKNEAIRKYFDYWGSRCYLFTNELNTNFVVSKKENKELRNVQFNVKYLKALNCSYIMSAVRIINNKENNLELVRIFSDKDAYFNVFLYKLI